MDSKKERPLILTAKEVNAVLAGDKTQHRVIFDFAIMQDHNCPFGEVGDRLWVQEPSLIHCDWDWFYTDNTLVERKEPFTSNDLHLPWDDEHQEYTGPIAAEYLPHWASRLFLEITNIRMERVQDITHNDSVKEAAFTFYPKQAVPDRKSVV